MLQWLQYHAQHNWTPLNQLTKFKSPLLVKKKRCCLMFNWLKKSKKAPASGKIVRKRSGSGSVANTIKKPTEAENKLRRLGVLKQSEQDTVREIRKYIRNHPKQAAQLIKLWLEMAEQRARADKKD
ncbi:hypothetical protein DU002_08340 [Corallincola holothuriorum]|uniref:Uncharacterized protein n=2 Tax=Corallincola TaxID=1775176 RepID=A0A368NKN0_9GAMM|nr:hypothetical protein DU002_08340 [Corallincola holothuriorum]